jgi:glycerophosphoryl diester phosphodiesterase
MVKIIAHRGFSKKAPENTLSAVHLAIQYKVDYIEIDVHLSKDGIPVVIHDAKIGRTTNEVTPHRITEMTLDKIKTLDAGAWFDPCYKGESIPTLDDILALNFESSGLMIEIKKGHSQVKPLATAVAEAVKKSLALSPAKKILLGSFSLHILREMRLQIPTVPLIGIAEDFNVLPDLISMKLPQVALWHKLISPQLLKKFNENNTKVWAFTIDDHKTAKSLHEIGVDGIITNDPQSIHSHTS